MSASSPPRLPAIWLVLTSILSVQIGASFAKGLFDTVPALGVSWLRFTASALLLWPVFRPWRALFRRHTSREWWLLAGFVTALVGMNMCIYLSFTHLPIGVAVTLEFLGPLAVAVAGSRRVLDVAWVALAALGVALLGFTPGSFSLVGALLALGAGAFWALYIVVGAKMGGAWRGVDALSVGTLAGALILAPIALIGAGAAMWDARVLTVGLMVGLLSTVVPYTLELNALQRIPREVFGILMSLEPAAAALAAFVMLGEKLRPLDLVAMACVIVASVGSTRSRRTKTP